MSRKVTRRAAAMIATVGAIVLSAGTLAWANSAAQTLPFTQTWTNTTQITANNDWSGVPGIVGYRGDGLAAAGANPQTVTADGSSTPVNVNANETNPSQNGNPSVGVSEFQIADPTIGMRTSNVAAAPHIVLSLNTTGVFGTNVSYSVRDIDASTRNTVSQFALQYRVGNTGSYTDVPAGYVADATTANTATQVTNVSAALPAAVDNKSLVQVRIITVDATSPTGTTDENVGVDNISVTDTNLTPVNTVPGAQSVNEDTALLFNNANGNKISVSDIDASSVQTRLQVTNGTLTLGSTAGTSFTSGSNGTSDMTFIGSVANVNAALDGLRFDPSANYNGPAQLTMTTDDLGNTGTGGAKTDSDTVAITVNPVNDAPTVSNIADRTTNEDTATADVPFTVGDVETAVGSLTVSGSSSNQTLVPNANITFGGIGANRTVKVTPAANESGTATITVTVADGAGPGSLSATDTFVLTVNAVNDPVTANADAKTVAEDAVLDFPASDLTANDSAGPNEGAQALAVTGVSGATNGTVDLAGGQVTYTPNDDYNGPAQFSYDVCDNGSPQECASATVNVTVNPVNDVPTISDVADKSTDEDVPAGPYSFAVSDVETAAASLTVTGTSDDQGLVPDANIEIGPANPTNGNRTVTVTPAQDEFGTATITLTVEDGSGPGSLSVTDTFVLTVRDTTPPAAPSVDLDAGSDTGSSSSDEVTKDTTPSFGGAAEAGSAVEIFDGATSLDTVTANAGGWNYTVPAGSALSDGDHNVRARATDDAGNQSSFGTLGVTVDTQDPETSITDDPANPTNATTAEFSFFSSQSGSTFECSLDGGAIEPCSSPKSYPGLSDGLHDFEVYATDRAGNADDSPSRRTWRIDTMDPTVSLTAPTEGAKVRGNVSLEADANDDRGIQRVEFLVDGASVDTDPSAPFNSSWDSTTVSDGNHTLRAWTTDEAGNDTTSAPVSVTVDNTAPDTAIDSDPPDPTNSASAAFGFSSDEPSSTFECKMDNGSYEVCTSPAEYQNLSDGEHVFKVRATDAAGNVDASPAERTFTVDTSEPSEPVVGSPADGSFSNSDDVTFSGSGDPGSTVRVFEGADLKGSATVGGGGEWSITLNNVADGAHTYTIKSFDAAGNPSTETSVTVTVETDAPAVTVVDPADGTTDVAININVQSWFSKDIAGPTLAGNYTLTKQGEPNPVDATVSYDAATDTATLNPDAGLEYGTIYTAAVQGGANGVKDRAGNPLDAGRTWSFTTGEAPDTTAPDVPEFTSPTDDSFDNDGDLTFSGTAEPDSIVELFEATESRGTDRADGNGVWTIALTGVAEGPHAYRARATDAADNTSGFSGMLDVNVDLTAPNTNITSSPANPTKNANASFEFSSENGATFECKMDDGTFQVCTSATEYQNLTDGEHVFRVRAIDAAGNIDATLEQHAWTVDTTAPDVSLTSPANDTLVRSGVDFSAEASDALGVDHVEFRVDGQHVGNDGTSQGGAYSFSWDSTSVSDGQHTFEARAVDAVGNDKLSASRTLRVDNTAPNTSITQSPSNPSTSADVSFEFESNETGTFECKMDDGTFQPCTSPQQYQNLTDGEHVFRVRAVDAAGNTDGSADERTFEVDTAAPDAPVIGAGPSGRTASTSAHFEFSAPGSTFECSLDGAAFSSCASPVDLTSLSNGPHTFSIKAIDGSGNASAPVTREWTVDTVKPKVVSVTPAASVKAKAAMITATFDEAMNASSLTNNPGVFKLMKKGSKKPLAIKTITYDASTMTVTVTPVKKLTKGTYTVTLMGGANGARDLAGNTLDVPSKVWKFKAK